VVRGVHELSLHHYCICVIVSHVYQVISMVSITTCCDCLNMVAFHQRVTTCSWVTTLTVENSHWRRYVCCLHTRSNIPRTSLCYVETMSVPASTASMDFTMNVSRIVVIIVCLSVCLTQVGVLLS